MSDVIAIEVVDFETTDEPPDAAVCEVGACALTGEDGEWTVGDVRASLVDPERFIKPQACAIHHITDVDVKGAPKWGDPAIALVLNPGGLRPPIFAAHAATFERAFFDPPGARWIDTYKVALRLAPQAPGWGLQVLRYWLGLKLDRAIATPAHRAGPDAYIGAHLLRRMLASGKMTIDEMVEVSAQPGLLPRINFGKHKGAGWDEVPLDYLEWVAGPKCEMGEDVKYTARHHLGLRLDRRDQGGQAAGPY